MTIALNYKHKPPRWNVQRAMVENRFLGLWKGCVLALPFWDPSVGRVEDVSGCQHHATLGAGFTDVHQVGTPFGRGLQWTNAATNSCIVPDPNVNRFDGTSTMSWEVIFKLEQLQTGTGAQDGLLSKYRTATGGRSWRLYVEGDGASNMEVELQVSSTGGNNEPQKTTTCKIVADVWYHLIVTYDAGVNRLWLNGTEHALTDHTTATTIFGGDSPLDVGTRRGNGTGPGDTDDWLTGVIASARIWDRVLSEQEAFLLTRFPFGMYQSGLSFPSFALEHAGGAAAGPWIFSGTAPAGHETLIIGGLMNDVEYEAQLFTVDDSGNKSAGSSLISGTPTGVTSVWPFVARPRVTRPLNIPWRRK
jgi:hypothetical protein